MGRLAGVAITIGAVVLTVGTTGASGPARQLPLEPVRDSGQGVTAAYEGWFKNADGSFSLLMGYFNRNRKQSLDIPISPDNSIDPGGPDRGQPSHFVSGRQWGVFTIIVPADFGDRQLTWTLVAHGQTTMVPMKLNPLYEVEPLRDAALGNTPPVLRFDPRGPVFQGPPRGFASSFNATVRNPTTLTVWASDDAVVDPRRRAGAMAVTASWSKFRGPGSVTFSEAKPPMDKADGKITTSATFSAPGEYVLRVQANDVSGEGGGGFQCCWTNALVKVGVSQTDVTPRPDR